MARNIPKPIGFLSDPISDPVIVALLTRMADGQDAVIAAVNGLRSDLARQQRAGASLSRKDRERLARVLPAIAGAVGSELFVVAEVLAGAVAVRIAADGRTAVQIGQLLSRAEGIPIAGLVIRRDGTEDHRVLWRIEETV